VFVLSKRPAQILNRIEIPHFAERDLSLKSKPEFRDVEKQLLDLLYRKQ
jgi:ABC-type nitrate/sulfonate/bicarbonate transport system ATPase subunit